MELLDPQDAGKIIGGWSEGYKDRGNGFVEPVYQDCREMGLGLRDIPLSAQAGPRLSYQARELGRRWIPDFMCCDEVDLELEAVAQLTNECRARVLNRLEATGCRLGCSSASVPAETRRRTYRSVSPSVESVGSVVEEQHA